MAEDHPGRTECYDGRSYRKTEELKIENRKPKTKLIDGKRKEWFTSDCLYLHEHEMSVSGGGL